MTIKRCRGWSVISTVLSRVSEGGTRPSSSNDERARGSSRYVVEEAAVPPLPSPLPTGTNRKVSTYT